MKEPIPLLCDALADDVLQNIHNREALIERLEKLHRESVVSRDSRIQRLLYGIHNASLTVVEAILAWNQFKQQAWYRKKTIELHGAALNSTPADNDRSDDERCPFNMFSWNGQNYMQKMLSDLDFVAEIPEVLHFMGPTTSFHRNPFLLPLNVDDLSSCHRDKQHQRSADSKKMSRIPWKDVNIQRVQYASFILLLDEYHREAVHSSSDTIDKGDVNMALYITNPYRDITHHTKFYPPVLAAEDFAGVTCMLDPPATSVITICCASLILNCVDADIVNKLMFLTKPIALKIFKQPVAALVNRALSYNPLQKIDPKMVNIIYPFVMHDKMEREATLDIPEPIILLSLWMRNLLVRTYDSESVNSRSFSVDKVFAALEIDHERRAGLKPSGDNNKSFKDDSDKENDVDANQCRNVSVQVQTEDIEEAVEKDSSFDKLQAIKDLFDPEPIKLIPLPIAVTIDVTEGNQTAIVNGDVETASSLEPGDILRIYHPYESSDWKVLTPPNTYENGKIEFKLVSPYDHSKIVAQEKKTRDDAIYRLCYGKDRTPSPDRVLSTIDINEHHDVASDQLGSIRSHLHIKEARIWKLIQEDKDSRPSWKRDYDDELVPWGEDYAVGNKYAELFRVRIKMETMERDCVDSPYLHCVHQQRVKFFEHVSLTKVIDEAFQNVCRWHPRGNLVDNVKWAKLSRKMKFMSNMKNAKHEIDMAFVRHNQDRKLDAARFHSILKDIASMQYPALPIDVSLSP